MSIRPLFIALMLIFVLMTFVTLSRADDSLVAPAGQLTLKTTKVVVFKDGYALFIKQATGIADSNGSVFTHEVPEAAVLGSFWAAGEQSKILSMRAEWDTSWKRMNQSNRVTVLDLASLLARLQDKLVTLELVSGQVVVGKLVQILKVDNEPKILIESNPNQTSLISLFDVSEVRGEAAAKITQINEQSAFRQAKRLSFDMGKATAGKTVDLTVMYFGPGIRWIPTYRVSGALTDNADLALQAEVLNEAEDLHDVALDLVVGVPSFKFREVISPLSLETTLRNALVQAAPQLMGAGNQLSNAKFSQRAGEWQGYAQTGHGAASTANIELPSELAIAAEQDLFVYSVGRFSLSVGGRATMPLWQSNVPLRHLYTLHLRPKRHPNSGYLIRSDIPANESNASPLQLISNHFWHQLELSNTSNVPWTTGAAITIRGHVPLGQDLLTYTPVKGKSLLPLTVAMDLRGTLEEEEVSREPNARTWNKNNYTLIVKKGSVTLTNYRDSASQTRITLSLGGKVTEASDDAGVRINEFTPDDWHGGNIWINNHSDVTWNITLKPGETRTLNYTCEFFSP